MASLSIRIFSYSSCSTCRKALKWLDKFHIEYELNDIVKNPPSEKLLALAIKQLGDKKLLFNTRGISYRNLGAEVVKKMNNEQAIQALNHDGKLIKRPFLVSSKGDILIGFIESNWEKLLLV